MTTNTQRDNVLAEVIIVNFATKLRNLRVSRGMTQYDLAKAIGTSQSSITSWEQNRREPDFKTIQKLADYFCVPMSSLLPSGEYEDDEFVNNLAESMHLNPKLRLLFDRTKNFGESDLDTMLAVANSIQARQG